VRPNVNINNPIAEIFWIAFDGGKGVRSVKNETSNNVYSGCKTCIVMPVVMDCQEQIIIGSSSCSGCVTGLAVVRLARLNVNEAVPK
jgi:hypothetical protein